MAKLIEGEDTRKARSDATAEYAIKITRAYTALLDLGPDDVALTAETVLRHAGAPLPPFLAPMDDAHWWASLASRQELKAYVLASFEAMVPSDQAAFLDHVSDRRAAA